MASVMVPGAEGNLDSSWPGKSSLSHAYRTPQAPSTGCRPPGWGIRPGEAFCSAGGPISGHLAAMAATPPSPVSGALISPRQGWASPDFFPSVSLPECPPLSPTTLHPTPHLKLAAPQEPPVQFPPSLGLRLPPPSAPRTPTPLLPLSHGNANQRPPLLVLGPSQGPGAVAQRPPPTLRSLARPGSHPAWKRDPGKASCLIPASQQLGAAGTLLRHWEPPFTALWNGHHEACLRHLEEGPW